ncbi:MULTISPECIES: membrane protein [Streptomyces]|uniref:membrane protein n=1 Tax=Streptomyces TaxID=1883 RepID=UPI0004C5BD7A|nr:MULTISPECIES: membrane protein [Streptomyces]
MLSGAFSTLGRYWKPLIGMALTLFGAATLVMIVALVVAGSAVAGQWDELTSDSSGSPDAADLVPLGVAFGVLMVIGLIVYLLASAVVQAAVPVVLQEAVLGRPIRFGAVWSRAWSRVGSIVGTVFLTGLIAVIPMALFTTAIAGLTIYTVSLGDEDGFVPLIVAGLIGTLLVAPVAVWLWVRFSLAPTVVVFENQRPVAALRRSAQLVRDSWWRVFGVGLLAYALASMIGYMIQMPFQMIGMLPGLFDPADVDADPSGGELIAVLGGLMLLSFISQMVAQLFTAVFPPLVVGLLYVDRRMRTENLGPVLAEAAAQTLPEQYGPPPARV